MAFAVHARRAAADINVVPLIDVLLVLLIIFMVTAPMLTHEVPVQLPRSDSEGEPERIRIRIGAAGSVHWDGRLLPPAAWRAALQLEAQRSPQPSIELEGDDEAAYQHVAAVLAHAHDSGLQRIGFVAR
jgi:biopolymer transport protein ExbD